MKHRALRTRYGHARTLGDEIVYRGYVIRVMHTDVAGWEAAIYKIGKAVEARSTGKSQVAVVAKAKGWIDQSEGRT
jgi:hypothetical protein